MLWYLNKSFMLIIVSCIIFTIMGHFDSRGYNLFLLIIYSFFLVAIPNTFFLLLLCWFNKEYKIFFRIPQIFIEVLLLYIIGLSVTKSIAYIPAKYRYETSSSYTSLRFYFTSPYIEMYQYLILLVFLFYIKKLFLIKKQTNKHNL